MNLCFAVPILKDFIPLQRPVSVGWGSNYHPEILLKCHIKCCKLLLYFINVAVCATKAPEKQLTLKTFLRRHRIDAAAASFARPCLCETKSLERTGGVWWCHKLQSCRKFSMAKPLKPKSAIVHLQHNGVAHQLLLENRRLLPHASLYFAQLLVMYRVKGS